MHLQRYNHAAAPRSIAGENPLRDAPQTSYGRRWCCRCQSHQPTKGGKIVNGMFTCAACAPKGLTL